MKHASLFTRHIGRFSEFVAECMPASLIWREVPDERRIELQSFVDALDLRLVAWADWMQT